MRNVQPHDAHDARSGRAQPGHDVEVLRRVYDAFNRRDIEALLAGMGPEIEIEETADIGYAALLLRVLGPRFVMLSGHYTGLAEVRRLFETVWEISELFEVEPRDFRTVGERVIVPLAMKAKAKETGIEGEALTVHLWTMRGGKGARLQVFATFEDALAAAG